MARKPAPTPKLPPGRPVMAHGTGDSVAPKVQVRLDAHSEAAVAALRAHYADGDGPASTAAALKRAVVTTAERECRGAYERALASILRRRETDASE